jgi:hypothetical protein
VLRYAHEHGCPWNEYTVQPILLLLEEALIKVGRT